MINIYGNGDLIEVKDKIDSRINGQQSIDLVSQKRFYDMWYQNYIGEASSSAQKVFHFIVARTFTFNKVKEIISLRDMSEGMYSREGELIVKGIGLKISMIRLAIQELEKLNYIIKTNRVDKANSVIPSLFEVNIEFFNNEIRKAYNMEKKVKIKNKGLQGITKKKHLINSIPEGYLSDTPCQPINSTPVDVVTEPLLMDCASLTNSISKDILYKETERNEQQPSGCDIISLGDLKRIYNNEMRANYGGKYIPPTGTSKQANKIQGQLKHLYKKLITIENLNKTKFIQFIVQEWKHVCTSKLSFLEQHSKSSLPVSPEVGIILNFTDKFLEAFRACEVGDPDKIEVIYGDNVGFRARELQKMGHTAEFAMKRAVLENEVANTKKLNTEELVEAERRKYELEMAKLRKEQDAQLTAMNNELRRVKEEAEKVKYSDIFNFSLNNMVDPDK